VPDTLELVSRTYTYEVRGTSHSHRQGDFVVDGMGLGERLGFEANRPWFGQQGFEGPWDAARHEVRAEELLGRRPASNQYGSGRLVLYRCHCGCDYCGVVSCWLEREGELVIWRDVRFEDDAEDAPIAPVIIERLTFPAADYEAAIERYVEALRRGDQAIRRHT
jgi:hypothetical protein